MINAGHVKSLGVRIKNLAFSAVHRGSRLSRGEPLVNSVWDCKTPIQRSLDNAVEVIERDADDAAFYKLFLESPDPGERALKLFSSADTWKVKAKMAVVLADLVVEGYKDFKIGIDLLPERSGRVEALRLVVALAGKGQPTALEILELIFQDHNTVREHFMHELIAEMDEAYAISLQGMRRMRFRENVPEDYRRVVVQGFGRFLLSNSTYLLNNALVEAMGRLDPSTDYYTPAIMSAGDRLKGLSKEVTYAFREVRSFFEALPPERRGEAREVLTQVVKDSACQWVTEITALLAEIA